MWTWDASLPQRALVQGYGKDMESDVATFQTEYGKPKMRPRSSYAPNRLTYAFRMKAAQVATFEAGWRANVKGCLPFQGPDFTTGTGTVTYEPVPGSNPKVTAMGRLHYRVAIEVRTG